MSDLQFQSINYFTKQFVTKLQTTVNVRISVKKEIVDVLSVGSDSYIASYDITDGGASFYGKTNIKFLYNDGAGLVSSNYNADFALDAQNGLLTPNTKLLFDVVTLDTNVDTNANTATVSILLEICLYAYVPQNVNCLVDGANLFACKNTISLVEGVDAPRMSFVIDEELTANNAIEGVLLAESVVCLSDHYFSDGALHLKGIATVRLTYTSDGIIHTDSLPFDFEREVDVQGISCNNLQPTVLVRTTKVRLDITQEGNKIFLADITCNLQLENAILKGVDVIDDCYSTDCDFALQKQQIVASLPLPTICAERTIFATLPKETDKKLQTAVNVSAVVTKCTAGIDCFTVDGIVYATAIYNGETIESALLEIPFSQKFDAKGVDVNSTILAKLVVTNFHLQDNGALDANITLCLRANISRDVTYTVITDVETTPLDKTQLPALEIYFANKGESLWDLAKNLHMSTEDILALNPELADPLTTDARIVIFNKI